MRAAPRAIRVIDEEFADASGLIERYRDRLPFAPGDPVVSLEEGSTPLVLAERLSERAGAEVWLKIEGANPTGSFKDRGMTCAVSAAVREGAEAVICASTGNTAASAAAYAARAGLRGAVIVPEGKIATGKLAQALMHGARVIALRGNFDEALELVRELVQRHPIALVNSRQPVPAGGAEDRGVRGHRRARASSTRCASRSATPATSPPTGRASASSASRRGCSASRPRAPRRSCSAQPVEHPETVASAIRIGNPARWEEAMDGVHRARAARVAAVSDAQILDAYRFLAAHEGVFCEPACAASVAGLLTHGADGAERVVCVLTGHGLKDPQTALAQAGRGRAVRAGRWRAVEQAVLA